MYYWDPRYLSALSSNGTLLLAGFENPTHSCLRNHNTSLVFFPFPFFFLMERLVSAYILLTCHVPAIAAIGISGVIRSRARTRLLPFHRKQQLSFTQGLRFVRWQHCTSPACFPGSLTLRMRKGTGQKGSPVISELPRALKSNSLCCFVFPSRFAAPGHGKKAATRRQPPDYERLVRCTSVQRQSLRPA